MISLILVSIADINTIGGLKSFQQFTSVFASSLFGIVYLEVYNEDGH